MKRACSILVVVLLVLMAAACGSAPASTTSTAAAQRTTPDWWDDILPPDDVLWGDGMAKQSSDSMSMQTAEARARVAIARQLNTLVQAMFTDYNLDAGNVNNQANSSLQENVSRQITNMNVSGAQPVKRTQMPDGTYYFRVQFKKSDAKSAVASILGNEEAAFAQFKAQQALDMLDAQLAKSDKSYRVDE